MTLGLNNPQAQTVPHLVPSHLSLPRLTWDAVGSWDLSAHLDFVAIPDINDRHLFVRGGQLVVGDIC